MSEETNEVPEVPVEPVVESPEPEPAPEPVSRGIKELTDVIAALDELATFLAKMLADGRVDGADVVHLVDLLKELDTFVEAVKGAGEIDDELKDLDQAEVLALGVAAFNLVKKVIDAVKKARK